MAPPLLDRPFVAHLPDLALVVLRIGGCLLVADLLSGFFHWVEDCYGQEHWPITGKWVTTPNVRHHREPRAFVANSWWTSARVLLLLGAMLLALAYLLALGPWSLLVVGIGVNANEVHKWTHRSRRENGRLVSLMQDVRLLPSASDHALHHRGGKNTHYCVLTPWCNPLLDRIGLWRGLEALVWAATGVSPRADPTVAEAAL